MSHLHHGASGVDKTQQALLLLKEHNYLKYVSMAAIHDHSQQIYQDINDFFPEDYGFSHFLQLCNDAVEALKNAATGKGKGFDYLSQEFIKEKLGSKKILEVLRYLSMTQLRYHENFKWISCAKEGSDFSLMQCKER